MPTAFIRCEWQKRQERLRQETAFTLSQTRLAAGNLHPYCCEAQESDPCRMVRCGEASQSQHEASDCPCLLSITASISGEYIPVIVHRSSQMCPTKAPVSGQAAASARYP